MKKKTVRNLLIVLVILAAIVSTLVFVKTELAVEESIVIKADRSKVYDNVVKFENFQKWSPWAGLDTAQISTITGTDGEVGAKFSWESKKEDVGTGSQTISSKTDDKVELDLQFTAPWESKSKVYYTFADEEGGVKVTWGFKQEGNLMMKMMIEGMLGEQYQKGLASLKKLCEE